MRLYEEGRKEQENGERRKNKIKRNCVQKQIGTKREKWREIIQLKKVKKNIGMGE